MSLLFSSLLTFVLISSTPVYAADKILSLDLCTDWMLAKYAKRSQVLALSPLLHQYPVDRVDNDWPTHDGTLEQILDLKPDLVITGEYNAIMLRKRLQELGIKVEILPLPKTLPEVIDYENHLLTLLDQMDTPDKPQQHQITTGNIQYGPRLLLLGPNGVGTGLETLENDILNQAGWTNYITGKGYVNLDLEKIIVDPPEAILWSASGSEALANLFADHPVLKKAIPKEKWIKTAAWQWRCPGPWTWDLVDQLHSALPKADTE